MPCSIYSSSFFYFQTLKVYQEFGSVKLGYNGVILGRLKSIFDPSPTLFLWYGFRLVSIVVTAQASLKKILASKRHSGHLNTT